MASRDANRAHPLLRAVEPACGWLWIALLAVVLFASALSASELAARTREVAYGCDSFGYLSMAREIRRAAATSSLPDFGLENEHARLVIEAMKSQRVRRPHWHELVAPHAHHYFPRSDQVAVQYPPGTGLALAIFPEGEAVRGLSRCVVWTFAAIGGAALLFAGVRRAWVAAGLVVLAVQLGLEMLVRLSSGSFSIAAVLPPILLACLLAVAAASGRAPRITAFAAGALLGLAVLVRIPAVLLVPGFLVLLRPRSWREAVRGPAGALVLGLALFGAAPLLVHQHRVSGAWYLPTYSNAAVSWPTLSRVRENGIFFLGGGRGSGETWALLPALAGFIGAVALARARRGHQDPFADRRLRWKRVAFAALTIWTTSTLFFVTHLVTTPYYNAPGTFAAVALLAFGALAIEASPQQTVATAPRESTRTPRVATIAVSVVAIGLALVPAVVTVSRVRRFAALAPAEATLPKVALPAELAAGDAWIYADLLTGSLWYYAHKPAFKIAFSDPETRTRLYRLVFDRDEPQYLIRDTESLDAEATEIELLGGTLEPRGEVAGSPYYLIRWPDTGPTQPRLPLAALR